MADPDFSRQAADSQVENLSRVESVREMYARGHEAVNRGDLTSALRIFQDILHHDASQGKARGWVGLLLHRAGRSEEALDQLNTAIAQAPGDRDVVHNTATVLLDMGERDLAENLCATFLAQYPQDDLVGPLYARMHGKKTGVKPLQTIQLDYPVKPRRRYTETDPHPQLYAILNRQRDTYAQSLRIIAGYAESLRSIPERLPEGTASPCWISKWLSPLDGMAIYAFIAHHRPSRYVEIGSGVSTTFARQAIQDHRTGTRLISIDPEPREEIDRICDEVIRLPLEEMNTDYFETLERGDILFIDGSHRAFQNSDATIAFIEVLPRLKPGVLVEIHDILLPADYPEDWRNRFYSEQYLLACYLLAETQRFRILLPHHFISRDRELASLLDPVYQLPALAGKRPSGLSFWLEIQ